jgi:hypothetical protein
MPNFTLNKRSLTPVLVVAAASLPAAAQARPDVGPGPVKGVPLSTPALVNATAPAPARVDAPAPAPARVNAPAPAPARVNAPVPAPAAASAAARVTTAVAEPGFQWGDAGIGAGGALVLVGGGAAALSITRRRRGQHSVA